MPKFQAVQRVVALVPMLALLGAVAPPRLAYPPTPKHPVADIYFGTKVVDPYRWLENGNAPETKAWAHAQSALAETFIKTQPGYAALAARVEALSKTSTNRFGLTIAKGRYVYLRQTPPEPQAKIVARDGLAGAERVLYDPAKGVTGASPAIGSVYVAPDGSKVAFTTQLAGAEDETLHVVDASSGKMLTDTITGAGGGTSPVALAWDGDAKGFIHTRFPQDAKGDEAHFNIRVYHHKLGTDANVDEYLFGAGLPKTAEMQLIASRDGRYTAAFVAAGDGVHEAVYVRDGVGDFVQVAAPEDATGSSSREGGHFVGDKLYVISSKRDPKGEIVAIDPASDFGQGKTIVPPGKNVIDDFTPVAGGFITSEIEGGDAVVKSYSADGVLKSKLPLPGPAALTELAADPVGGDVIVGYQSYATPNRWLAYNAASNTLERTGIERKVPGDYSKVVVKRVFVPSLDGSVKIPLEIVSLPNHKRDGSAPTYMTAYGAYGVITSPTFIGPTLAWLEKGGVFAQAMIRGGGEYGEAWHMAARLEKKTIGANDLAACAKWLAANGYGNAKHLGIIGGSAGGFLMGLALTRNPQSYRAVVSAVGFYDLLRTELSPNGAFNTPEFGTVKEKAQFTWMLKQSPYLNVKAGARYPAVLMTTGENDPRVEPFESRKMIARLQAASSSSYPILLLQKSGEGHGIGNSFAQRVSAATDRLAFFESQLR